MTRQDQTQPIVENIVSDLWFSLFETTFDALRIWMRRLGTRRVCAGRASA